MVNPVALSLLPEVWILVLHLFNHHDREVICGVARGVELLIIIFCLLDTVMYLPNQL